LTFAVNANAEQLRAQLALARLQEVSVEPETVDAGQSLTPPAGAASENVLRFRW